MIADVQTMLQYLTDL